MHHQSHSVAPYKSTENPATLSGENSQRVRHHTPQRNEIAQTSKANLINPAAMTDANFYKAVSEMNVQPSQVSSELQDRIDDLMRYNKEMEQKLLKANQDR